MPISQISQQLNAVVMALAGAERIFALIDEQPETEDGYVELVNARENGMENNFIIIIAKIDMVKNNFPLKPLICCRIFFPVVIIC